MTVTEEYKNMLVSLVEKLERYPEVMSQCFKELEYLSSAQKYMYAAEVVLMTYKFMKEKNASPDEPV